MCVTQASVVDVDESKDSIETILVSEEYPYNGITGNSCSTELVALPHFTATQFHIHSRVLNIQYFNPSCRANGNYLLITVYYSQCNSEAFCFRGDGAEVNMTFIAERVVFSHYRDDHTSGAFLLAVEQRNASKDEREIIKIPEIPVHVHVNSYVTT